MNRISFPTPHSKQDVSAANPKRIKSKTFSWGTKITRLLYIIRTISWNNMHETWKLLANEYIRVQ